MKPVCGNPCCGASTGIHDPETSSLSGLTFGRGELDRHGYWSIPCAPCARAFEKLHPEAVPCWPFEEEKDEQAA
jgi:hypothetical protein